jgi:hypothetical protein
MESVGAGIDPFLPTLPARAGATKHRLRAAHPRRDRIHDPRRHQLAIEWPIGVRNLPITSQPTAQQLPGPLQQIARVGRREPLPLDPFLGLAKDFLPPRPSILGEAVIGLGVAIGARHRGFIHPSSNPPSPRSLVHGLGGRRTAASHNDAYGAWVSGILSALFFSWRGRDKQAEQQEHVVQAYREEAKLEAQPDKPWKETIDDR